MRSVTASSALVLDFDNGRVTAIQAKLMQAEDKIKGLKASLDLVREEKAAVLSTSAELVEETSQRDNAFATVDAYKERFGDVVVTSQAVTIKRVTPKLHQQR